MAKAKRKSIGAWGIDIGQCALKALRCSLGADDETVVAEAYDYIEYPKVLSQPDADPDELIKEALEQFLSRNVHNYYSLQVRCVWAFEACSAMADFSVWPRWHAP